MFGLRAPELILIILAIVLLFGTSRLPQLARSLGQSRKAFKDAFRESEDEGVPAAFEARQIDNASNLTDEEILAEMQRRSEARSKA
jgi:sec-independent protein translocase protein TatA